MKKEFIPLIGFDEKKTWVYYVPLFILKIISFKLFARKMRIIWTEFIRNADLNTDSIRLIPKK